MKCGIKKKSELWRSAKVRDSVRKAHVVLRLIGRYCLVKKKDLLQVRYDPIS